MSKVLMITYVFPPAAWVGAHRTLKYCKYLGAHGWTPVVLTAKPIGVTFLDEKLLRQIPPDVVVHRTFDLDPAKWEEKLAARKQRSPREPEAAVAKADAQPAQARPSPLRKLKVLVKALLKDSPDSHVFWVPFAFFRGLWILMRERIDVIYCSTPPHSSHLIAYLLAMCARKPYVLDFRDPWYVEGSARKPEGKIPALLRLETWAKRRIVLGAKRIVCVSNGELAELRAEYPEMETERFACITNGFDPSDFEPPPPPASKSAQLQLIHAGTIYSGVADELFEALRRMVLADPGMSRKMRVHLLGDIAHSYENDVRELEGAGIVIRHGLLPHAKTLQMVHASDVVVILMGGDRYLPSHLPSKAFEYLHARKPILAIAGEGELAQLVRASGLGIVVLPHSVDGLVDALRRLMGDHVAGRAPHVPDQAFIRRFERQALAAQLAVVLADAARAGAR
jgi:glycosyltransferase involved in cell wall biosynthesis